MPIIPALGRQSPVDLFELEVSLVHIANFRPPELFTETLSQKRKGGGYTNMKRYPTLYANGESQ